MTTDITAGRTTACTCTHCGKSFRDAVSLYQHTKAKHGRRAAQAVRPPRDDDKSSIADELIEAIEAAHAGETVPGYLLTMFPDSFPRGTEAALASPTSPDEGGQHG